MIYIEPLKISFQLSTLIDISWTLLLQLEERSGVGVQREIDYLEFKCLYCETIYVFSTKETETVKLLTVNKLKC